MKVRIVTKYDVPVYDYIVNDSENENHRLIPDLGDHIEVDEQRYQIVDRTFFVQKNEVVLQAWQPILDDETDSF